MSRKNKKKNKKVNKVLTRKIKNSNLLNPENIDKEIFFEHKKNLKSKTEKKSKNNPSEKSFNQKNEKKEKKHFIENNTNSESREVVEKGYKEIIHKPVLLKEVIEKLDLKEGEVVFDGTLGQGGYSEEILKRIKKDGVLIATDLDVEAIKFSERRLKKYLSSKLFFQKNFSEIDEIILGMEKKNIDKAVLDLGFGSHQLDNSKRGISFLKLDEPLNMNLFSGNSDLTAKKIINFWEEETLADIFSAFGGEKHAKLIAKKIVEERQEKEFENVGDLTKLLIGVLGPFYKKQKIHPATRVFQALRIVVNDELGNLEKALKKIFKALRKNGVMAIVTFHSLEDKIVKKYFRELEDDGFATRVNRKVIKTSESEKEYNKRARSAKLRVLIKAPRKNKKY